MADRYPVSEVVQIGVESVAGTAVTPTKQMASLSVELNTALELDPFGPMGQLTDTLVIPRQEWAEGELSGVPTYTEIVYPLSNLFGAAVITTPSGATNRRLWSWNPDASTPWTPITWTVRRGVQGGTAEEANYCLLSGLTLNFSRTEMSELGGDLFAQRLNYGATMAAASGVSTPALIPMLPAEGDIYLDTTGAGLGVTKLTRAFSLEVNLSGLFGPIWPINSANASFAAHGVQKPEDLEVVLRLGNDAVGRGLVTNMRAGTPVFLRYQAISGQNIEASNPYKFTLDMALMVSDAPSRETEDDLISTLEWTFKIISDATWGSWLKVAVENNLTGLA